MPVTSWNVSTGAAPLTPARPSTLQPGNNHIDWLFKEGRKMFWLQLSKRRVPEGILTGCAKQAAVAAVHPEQRLVPLVCACSFGSVTPPPPPKALSTAVKKGLLSPGGSREVCGLPGSPSFISLGNSAPVWRTRRTTATRIIRLSAIELR